MSNKPSNDRGGQRPTSRSQPSLSLSQVGRDGAPLLIPITPNSSIDEITQIVRNAGVARVELLVPDGTTALQSIAGNETLREAAKAAGVRLTLFTADEKTTHAARFAKLDVVSVGGTVAAPRPGDTARRTTGPRPAVQPATPPPTPRPPQVAPGTGPNVSPQPRPTEATRQVTPPPPAVPPMPAMRSDADFLSALNSFDDLETPQPRVRQSEQGAVMYDTPGDVGVQRPAQNDDEWQAAFGELDSTIANAEPAPPPRRQRPRREEPVEPPQPRERLQRPSIFGALLGSMPSRTRRPREAEPVDDGMRMARPERTAEETGARRRQSRNLLLGPLLALLAVLLLAIPLISYALTESFNPLAALSFVRGPVLQIAPPVNQAEAEDFSGQIVPLVREPVTDQSSINVQGVLLTTTVTETVEGTSTTTSLVPIGFARGSITMRNRSSQAVTIPAGLEVDVNGLRFAVENSVTVPAAVSSDIGITFGAADAPLVARNPGEEGNIPAGSIAGLPGYSGNIVVQQNAPFSGGSNQQVTIVAPADVDPLLPQALNRLYAKGVQSLQSQVQQLGGFAIVRSESTPEITPTQELLADLQPGEYAVFPPIGNVTQDGKFLLEVSETFAALASPVNQPIDQQLQRAVANQIRQQRPELAEADVQITSWRRSDQGIVVDAVATPRSGVQQVPSSLAEDIKTQIAGLPRDEAQEYLNQLQENGSIGNFTLPEDWETVPNNVNIQFSTGQDAQ